MALSFQSKIRPVGNATGTTQNEISNVPGGQEKIFYPAGMTPNPDLKYKAPTNVSFASKVRPISTPPVSPETPQGSTLGNFAKGIFSAPATLLARPVQLGAELLGASAEDVNKFSNKYGGGLVAPVPENAADVKKDVGRGIQTVALGVPSAPLVAGTAFGVGTSLEQGNDLFSAQTALQAVIGGAAGKVLDLVGKPLLDATGKVIGTITPKILKDVAAKGAGAVNDFMAQHELLGGIAKPLSEKITKGATATEEGIGKLFTGGKGKIAGAISDQYPGLSKESMQKHFEAIDNKELFKPTTEPGPTYKNATNIYKEAKAKGINLDKVASDNKIYATDLQEDGKWMTRDAVDALRKETMSTGHDLLRPALQEAQAGVQAVPISEVRDTMISRIDSIPKSKITDAERLTLRNRTAKEFADNSPAALQHPYGYNLTELHDANLAASNNVVYNDFIKPNVKDKLSNTYYKTQSTAFNKLLEKKAPPELNIPKFKGELQKRFLLADYLEQLNGKKVAKTLFQRTLKKASQLGGAAIGGSTGGMFGAFGGYTAGGMAMDSFANASNPVKIAFLNSIEKTNPEIFKAFEDYFGREVIARLRRPLLGAGKNIPILPNTQGTPNIRVSGSTPDVGGFTQRFTGQ